MDIVKILHIFAKYLDKYSEMKKRTERLLTIKRIISTYPISGQDELLEKLNDMGFNYTQATLSRDLKFLKVGKIVDDSKGNIYVLPEMQIIKETSGEDKKFPVSGFLSLEFSGNLAVIKTMPGFAGGIASAVDNLKTYEILGTIAGDDTILIIPRNNVSQADIRSRLALAIPEINK